MSVDIKGIKEVEDQLSKMFGRDEMLMIVDNALTQASKPFVSELEKNFDTFKDTGASKDEITVNEPIYKNGVRTIVVNWRGSKDRYRLIHLNEFGYTKNGKKILPRGLGAIARSLRSSESVYFKVVKEELSKKL